MSETAQNMKKRFLRKSGRTLVLKLKDEGVDVKNLTGFTGLKDSATTQNNAVFLTFDTKDNALEALKQVKKNFKEEVNVKFAHYKVFFKMEGLVNTTDYYTIKKDHTEWVEKNSGGEVLYYKLYRKDNKYLGCGDLTVDTKDSIDALLSEDRHKNYTLGSLTGTFYRYNRNNKQQLDVDSKEV